MTVDVEDGAVAAAEKKRSYIVRHWRGELSLPQSYWVNGVLIGMPFNIYYRVMDAIPMERPIDYLAWVYLPYFLLTLPLAVWQYVGIWRSAGNRIREGRQGWAWVARVLVIVGTAAGVYFAVVNAKSTWSMSAAYLDERASTYKITQTGNRVTFSGKITPESADSLDTALEKAGIGRLVIRQSVGGYILPALRLAETIHRKKLTVVVTSECSSICAVLLAAGIQRFILPESVIRLHTATIVGTGEKAEDSDKSGAKGVKDAEAWLRRAGAGDELLVKIRAHHGPYDFYEPTVDELIRNGLVTDVFDSHLSGYLPAREWCDQNPQACAHTGLQNRTAASPSH